MTGRIVTIGETLACLSIPDHASLGSAGTLRLSIGGAESNVAIAARQLGVRSTWMGRIGDDDLGALVMRELRGADVDVDVRRDDGAPTGLMVKEHRRGRPVHIRYYRTGSAGSRLTTDDIDVDRIVSADVLHVTGITAALGRGPHAAILHAMRAARAAGTLVSFDVNHRATLWSEREAALMLPPLITLADVVFAGPEEAALVLDGRAAPLPRRDDPWQTAETLAHRIRALGPRIAVVKLGPLGVLVLGPDGPHRQPAIPTTVVDPVGAGDAFVGGFLGEIVRQQAVPQCSLSGARLAALVCAVPGDWEGALDWPGKTDLDANDDALDVVR